jgi:hypothetical protein
MVLRMQGQEALASAVEPYSIDFGGSDMGGARGSEHASGGARGSEHASGGARGSEHASGALPAGDA